MSTTHAQAPARVFLLVELPALPVMGLLILTGGISLILSNVAVLGWTALTVAGLDGLVLATFLIGGRPLQPLSQNSLLAQVLAPFGRFLLGALSMVASGFLGAIIAIYLAADITGSGFPAWSSSMLGTVISFAVVLGLIGSVILLSRRVLSLTPRARAKSLRRGIRRLCRAIQVPEVGLDARSLALRHLSTTWYLLWLPLLSLVIAAAVLAVTV